MLANMICIYVTVWWPPCSSVKIASNDENANVNISKIDCIHDCYSLSGGQDDYVIFFRISRPKLTNPLLICSETLCTGHSWNAWNWSSMISSLWTFLRRFLRDKLDQFDMDNTLSRRLFMLFYSFHLYDSFWQQRSYTNTIIFILGMRMVLPWQAR